MASRIARAIESWSRRSRYPGIAAASAPSGANTSSRELIDPDPDAPRLAAQGAAHRHRAELEPFAPAPARHAVRALVGRRVLPLLHDLHLHGVARQPWNHLEAARRLLHHRDFLRHHAGRGLDELALAHGPGGAGQYRGARAFQRLHALVDVLFGARAAVLRPDL